MRPAGPSVRVAPACQPVAGCCAQVLPAPSLTTCPARHRTGTGTALHHRIQYSIWHRCWYRYSSTTCTPVHVYAVARTGPPVQCWQRTGTILGQTWGSISWVNRGSVKHCITGEASPISCWPTANSVIAHGSSIVLERLACGLLRIAYLLDWLTINTL